MSRYGLLARQQKDQYQKANSPQKDITRGLRR